ncbi:adenomatous polyposis coli protein [Biomphalaria pfeifferi]|uniref:Adenomatous polyposis coli protein n=1 Tax=Biomphalaria pfeifferi TaxID=112525 RepID=A0AAD8C7H6_BIOPF|nr:adenomatous polyposis coli protein [Biomphalaria pfeifferi]
MSCWLIQPVSLEHHLEGSIEDEDEDYSDEDALSGTPSECSKEYEDDDDFDNKSLEIDEEERHKISAQINADDTDEEADQRKIEQDDEEKVKEEIPEKEDTGHEKDLCFKDEPAFASHTSLCNDSFDDEFYQGQATASGLEEGETSMTESAETVDIYERVQKLDSERQQLMQDFERDENQRKRFYNQLKSITQQMESLQHSEHFSEHVRRQMDVEAHKVQGAMQEKLGTGEQSKLRQEARLERIKNIESEMGTLMAAHKKLTYRNIATATHLSSEMFKLKPDQEDGVGGYVCDRIFIPGSHCVSLATQTGEVAYTDIPDGLAPGMPINPNLSVMYHGAWPIEKVMSNSGASLPASQDLASVISFNSTNTNSGGSSSSGGAASGSTSDQPQQLGSKVEMVYSLLSMLGTHDKDDMSRTLFAMSQSQDSCIAMRQSGCLPLLLQLLHGSDKDSGLLGKTRGSRSARARAAAALHNIVHCHHDDKRGRHEARTLRLLEQIRAHCDQQRGDSEEEEDESVNSCSDMDHHPGSAIAALMKLSFDEDYRHAICTLGGLQAIAELLEIENRVAGPAHDYDTTVRRYACMTLTNLTFGEGKNKALLCSMKGAMEALVDQLRSPNEDLIQAAASVLRNLSWRADLASKKTLREIGAVTTLMKSAMIVKKETTLKSILSALWNLSSHCSENKAEICAVDGALQFLVGLLTYKSAAKTLAIVENGGGILRNVSSQIAIREDYRLILRQSGCLQILLHHLRSTSLTIVSNACGTLWNLSARCEEDQNTLREMGAVSMLKNLVHSRHKMISSGSSAALRNLVSSIPSGNPVENEKTVKATRPSLHARKQRAMEAELDQSLSETCDNVDSPRDSPTDVVHRSESEPRRFVYNHNQASGASAEQRQADDSRKHLTRRQQMPKNSADNANRMLSPQRVARAGSQDSVGSTHSDISHDRTRARSMLAKSSHLLHKRQGGSLERKEASSAPHVQHTDMSMSEHKQANYAMPGMTLVNNTPAHVRRPTGSYYPQGHNQPWQNAPNSRIVQYMHEVALYNGVEPSLSMHGQLSLTQSAPNQSMHYFNQQSLFERLAKSSSGINSTSLNFDSCTAHPQDEDTDQPVNYSLKYQDCHGNNKLASNRNINSSYNHTNNSSNFRPITGMEHNYKNNSNQEKKSVVNNVIQNPAILTPTRPVPNLVHNRFHTPQMHRSVGNDLGYHPAQFMTPQGKSYSSSHEFDYHYPPSHILPSQGSNLSLTNGSSHPGFTSTPGKRFNNSSTQFRTMPAAHQNKTHHLPMQQLSVYAETDLDCVVDQPTDFSLRYNEVSEESCSDSFQEQPINYSIRYRDNATAEGPDIPVYQDERHCVECKYAEAMRADYRMDNSSNDDQVRTFCTEGTPYLSTATSLTDLTQAGKADGERDEEDEDMNMSGQDIYDDDAASKNATLIDPDRTLTESDRTMTKVKCEADHAAGSSGSQTTDRRTGSTVVCGSSGCNSAPMSSKASSQMSDIQTDQPNFHADTNEGALDQTKTYCEEGTPVCFSRVSSLSSLHSSEARDGDGPFRLVGNMTEKIELANIEEIETPEARVIENKQAAGASGKPGSKLRRTSTDQVARTDREAKTVTFDENHQVEETPLMFSRSSSPESLSSFDTQSVHSSVISEYSRRASEVVSPSDIPDSPSESMPSSPRRTHSPTRRFKDFGLGPKSLAAAKQILEFSKPVNLFKPEPYLNFTSFDEEDKPINFAIRNAEKNLPLLNTFADFEEDQPVNFSAYSQETPPITFSTFQKNIAPPSVFPNNVTNRAKTLPTLVEHANESEVAVSVKLEIPASYLGLNPAPKMFEIPAKEQSIATKTQASTQAQEPNLTKVQETESGAEIVTKMASAPTTATVVNNKPWSPATEQLKQEDRDSSMSEVSEGEEDILAQCISSGMPTPSASSSARKMRRATVENNVRKKSAIPTKASAIPKLSTPSAEHSKAITSTQQSSTPTSTKLLRSGVNPKNAKIPLKSEPAKTPIKTPTLKISADAATSAIASGSSTANFMVPSTAHTAASVKSSVSKNLTPALNRAAQLMCPKKSATKNVCDSLLPHTQNLNQFVDTHEDCIRSYATEGTPLNFSAATSLSDLSVLTQSSSPSPKKSSSSNQSLPDDAKSDNSSVCEERDELLLSQAIESARPKSKSGRKSGEEGTNEGRKYHSSEVSDIARDSKMSAFVPRTSNVGVVGLFHDFIPTDTVKVFRHEGSSKNSTLTLSDITIDSVEGSASVSGKSKYVKQTATQKYIPQLTSVSQNGTKYSAKPNVQGYPNYNMAFSPTSSDVLHVYQDEGTPVTFSRNDSLSSLGGEDDGRGTASGLSASPHKDRNRSNERDESDSSSSIPKERHVIGQSSEDSSVAGDKVDRPIKFVVEDTPVCFSRNSSLSSITSLDKPEQPFVPAPNQNSSTGIKMKLEMKQNEFNDSLNDELADCDPTPSEQALLEQCINSVMPKSRHFRGEDKTKRHSRGKFFVPKAGGNIAINGGLTKSASLEMTTGLSNGYHSGSDNGSQGSLSHDQSSHENLMTRSCSDTTELDLDLQATPSSRQSRYCNWRRQRHLSQGENTNARSHFRSHSQDNDNYLKAQKEISNKLAKANCHIGQHMYQGSLESFQYVLHDRQLGSQTNQMKTSKEISDFAAKVREISNDNMGGLLALRDDVDIDTAVFNDHSVVELTADESVNQILKVDYDDSEAGNVTIKAENTCELNSDVHFFIDEDEDPDYDEVYDGNISLEEEERLLAENVHLIMSEIQTTKMSGSTVDEDLFIENETISLVSNDYASDTNSEISTTWSDKNSDFSSATLAENKSHGSSKSGPKIVKPGMNLAHVQRLPQEDCAEDAKGIRGRRKPLYPGKSNNAKVKPGSVSQNTKIVLPQKSASVQAIKKTPPKQPMVAQVSPRTRQPGQNSQINSNPKKEMQKKTSPRSRSAGPAPGKVTTNGKQSNPRAAQGNSPAARSSMTKPVVTKPSSSPPSSTATKNTNVVKPTTPPTKLLVNSGGGSFSNTVNQTLSSENKENKQRTESLNITSGDSGNRLSNGLTSDSWNKTFNSSDYIEENAQDKPVQMNSKEAPAVKRALKTPNKSPSSIPTIAKASVSCNNSQNQSKLPTLSQGNKAFANVSPNQTNKIAATSASRSVSGNSLSQTASEKKSSITKNISSPANVGTVKGFNRSLSNDTKASNVNRSNDSLKAPNRPLTPVSSGNSRRSSHSSTSGIPTKALDGSNSSLNTECNKRTPPGVSNKKQVPSKIAALWKRDGSLERSPSRESPSSSASSLSKLPVSTSPSSTKPSSLPPSGFKAKAATLPASSSLTVSKSSSDGLCKSATYEKIASDVKVAKSSKQSPKQSQPRVKKAADVSKLTQQKQTSYESPESGVRRGEVFELYDDHEEDDQNLYDTNDSLESNVFDDSMLNHQTTNDHSESADSLDQSCDSSTHIDSSTFRKKRRDPSISNLELPNADETCKSMCSFNDSIGFNQSLGFKQKTSVTDISFISDKSMSDTRTSKNDKKNKQEEKGITKSKVAQGLKRLFSSSRHKDKESKKNNELPKSKSADKELSKGKKCSNKEKKNHKDKKDYDFFSANIKIEPSTMCDMEDKLICHQGTSTSITPKPGQLRTEHKVSPSAIVAPFNYNPPSTMPNGNASGLVAEILSSMPVSTSQQCSDDHLGENRDSDSLSSNPGKHLTKTEMLLARRRQRNLSTGKDDSKSDAELLAACMVTTV